MSDALDRVQAAVAAREAAGLRRVLRPRAASDGVLDLASNDYLGLCHDPRVTAAAADAARRWGGGATGSRLVTGTTELHCDLEDELAAFCRAPAALVFSSGYLANVGVLTALGGPDVAIVSDAGNHASLIDGCRLSGSPTTVVGHRDVAAVDAALAARDTAYALVVTDAVFSVDGDLAPLAELHAVARSHGALLVVDEAHALGVIGPHGRGGVEAVGLADEPDVVRTLVLSKSLGAQGGAVLAVPEVIDLLVNTARPFIFDTGLAPAAAGAARAALGVLAAEPERVAAVRTNAAALAGVLRDLAVETIEPDAAVVPGFLGDPRRAFAAATGCLERGVRVGCFRPPSVPPGRSCLRLTARADLRSADLDRAAGVLAATLADVGVTG
ncbi:8-amino-7-oxononanoate synthase [Jatrophihabitans endophyticus]|uniref:8-amino-7-oxononanoate synthase n=1 Tax=Jatrophihabitans endophyticus TaxID=1206085 RepID=A0A1M5T242_9ACTN|nr:8-amino-7-oxononanoate synthase [Jatrophihabitans endophyticus]SHH44797.1 8-amino-7-oxononanoate synthase [Jatrophihabitans endophyticus]